MQKRQETSSENSWKRIDALTSEEFMLIKRLRHATSRAPRTVWLSLKGALTVWVSAKVFRIACGVILTCAPVLLELHTQAQAPTAPTDDQKRQIRKTCEENVIRPKTTTTPTTATARPVAGSALKMPDNIEDGAKAALACEWIDKEKAEDVLDAFRLLTTGPQPADLVKKVLHDLEQGSLYPYDQGLYTAAMGDPDQFGQPTAQGLPNFLDILAKANTLKKKKPDDEDALFGSTETIVGDIFETESGKIALVRIHDLFTQKNNYVALYELLKTAWVDHDEKDLEQLRAAFEMNSDKLAKQVAAKIQAPKD